MIASRTKRRRSVAALLGGAVAMLAGAAVLTGCSSGQLTQTASQVAPIQGANANTGPGGTIQLRNLLVAYSGPKGYPLGGSAALSVRIFNSGPAAVKLVGASAASAARSVRLVGGPTPTVSATPSPSAEPSATAGPSVTSTASPEPTVAPEPPGQQTFAITVAPDSYELLVPGQGEYLQLTDLTAPLVPGMLVAVTFRFDDGSAVEVSVPLGPPTEEVPRATPLAPESESE